VKKVKDLEKLPILHKEPIRKQPEDFIDLRLKKKRLRSNHTSGTTGKPLTFWFDRTAIQRYFAYYEGRSKNWADLKLGERYAMLGGKFICPIDQKAPPFWRYNKAWPQLYFSGFHLSPQYMDYYLEAMKKYEIRVLMGRTSSLHHLAVHALNSGINIKLRSVQTQGENLFTWQRRDIEKAFQTEVYDFYGLIELVAFVSECAHHQLHLSPEVGVAELLDKQNKPVVPGESGRIIATGLLNKAMPLIRYDTGDKATAQPNGQCPCGRTLPLIEDIDGRVDDCIYTPDNRLIDRLAAALAPAQNIVESQLIQETINRVIVRFVPGQNYSSSDGELIVKSLKKRIGEMEIILEPVDQIPRGPTGKFQFVISKLQRPHYLEKNEK